MADHKFLFFGAGAAGVGIADLIALAIQKERPTLTLAEARKRIWLVDSKGLVTADRTYTRDKHKLPYAHTAPVSANRLDRASLASIVATLRPTALIGVSAQPGAFDESICQCMATINERPIIFSLSNPTTLCECTPYDAYTWTRGKCIYSSGSPFGTINLPTGETFRPGQGNNAYVFPGIGLAAIIAGAKCITEDDFFVAAQSLAAQVTGEELALGSVYPSLGRLREVSVAIAVAVMEHMFHTSRATKPLPLCVNSKYREGDKALLTDFCHNAMYTPSYDFDAAEGDRGRSIRPVHLTSRL